MVNSRGFCLGQWSRKSLRLMPPAETPSSFQNSGILRQSAEACSSFNASGSARSLPRCSLAAVSFSFGCSAASIFLVGALPRSQYLARASRMVQGVGKGFLTFTPLPSAATKVTNLARSASTRPKNGSMAATSAGSLSGSMESVPPRP